MKSAISTVGRPTPSPTPSVIVSDLLRFGVLVDVEAVTLAVDDGQSLLAIISPGNASLDSTQQCT